MSEKPAARHPDIQAVSDASASIYEAIATLEYSGQRVSASALVAATGLHPDALAAGLDALMREGLLTAEDDRGERVYGPARRGWSAAPDQAEGKGLA
jgi:DNA-binding transcriptional ArsR family regulator